MIASGSIQMRSVVAPIIAEAKKQGFSGFTVTCEVTQKDKIFIPSGLSIEEVDYATINKIADKVRGLLAPGEYYISSYLKAHSDCNKLKMVGWPKSDVLFSPNVDKMAEEIKTKLNLTFDKTVLWADCMLALPFEKWVYTEPARVQVLESMLTATEKLGVNLIVKPHLYGRVFDVRKEHYRHHVKWINPNEWGDVTALFLVSDVLFCDGGHTSVGTEFMVTKKPVVVVTFPFGFKQVSGYRYGEDFPEEEFPAISTNLEFLERNLETCLSGDDGLEKLRQKHVERIIYKPDGHASERAVEVIKQWVP